MMKKIFKNQNSITILLLFLIFLFTSVPYVQKGFNFLKSKLIKAELIDGKKYYCPFISNDEKKSLKSRSDLISNIRNIRNESGKLYDEKIGNCGTDKEYGYSLKVDSLIPSDLQSLLDKYRKTKTYTIGDFQECIKFWVDAKKEDYEEITRLIEGTEEVIEGQITKNNCSLLTD